MNFTLHFLLTLLLLVCVSHLPPAEAGPGAIISSTAEPFFFASTSEGSGESADDGDDPESFEETESGEEDDGMASDDDADSLEATSTEDPLEDDGGAGDSDEPEEDEGESDEDPCAEIGAEGECEEALDADMNQMCVESVTTGECISIGRRAHGVDTNSYQNGFVSAQSDGIAQQQSLNAIVGVLCGVIGVLLFVIVGGGYWMWRQLKANQDATLVRMTDVHEEAATDRYTASSGDVEMAEVMQNITASEE